MSQTAPQLARGVAKFESGGKKILNCLKFPCRHLLPQSASSVRQVAPTGANISPFVANNPPIWNPLECNGARQVASMRDFAPHGDTWRHVAPCLRHYAPNNSNSGNFKPISRPLAQTNHQVAQKYPSIGANGANRVNFGIKWPPNGANWRNILEQSGWHLAHAIWHPVYST